MKNLFFILLTSFVFSHLEVSAYIPPSRFIFEQTVKKNPPEAIHFETEVTLTRGVDQFKIKEQWYMNSDNTFHVHAQGLGLLKDQFKTDLIFSGSKKNFSLNGQKSSVTSSNEIPERLIKMNSLDRMGNYFERLNVIPAGALNKKIFSVKNNEYSYEVESFVRLSRALGLTSYLIKLNPYAQQEEPALWIEQDRFAIRKVRFPSGAVAEFDLYADYEKTFHLPRKITITWAANKAEIKITPLGKKAPIKNSEFLLSALEESKGLNQISHIPGADIVTEFYSRFR